MVQPVWLEREEVEAARKANILSIVLTYSL
jgi:hypothetical protein